MHGKIGPNVCTQTLVRQSDHEYGSCFDFTINQALLSWLRPLRGKNPLIIESEIR